MDEALKEMNKVKAKTCKNGGFALKKKKGGLTEIQYGYAQAGCENMRADGSAYCGKCRFITK